MNLIDQLGGYEKAKEYLAGLQRRPMHEQTEDTISYLPDALLKYRRQHNIFEAGDKVVLSSADTEDLLLEIVNQMYTPNMHRVRIIATGRYGPVFKDDIRHATDAEISAGKRL